MVERDWWVQTHWEDSDSREVYRQLIRSPILRDMVSTARMYPGARVMIVKIDQVPPPEEHKPRSAHVFTVSLTVDQAQVLDHSTGAGGRGRLDVS